MATASARVNVPDEARPLKTGREKNSFRRNQDLFVLSIIAPMLLFFLIFYIYPIIVGFVGSLTNWRAFQEPAERLFVGFDNYVTLFNDSVFMASLGNTFKFALLYMPLSLVLALTIALADQCIRTPGGIFSHGLLFARRHLRHRHRADLVSRVLPAALRPVQSGF